MARKPAKYRPNRGGRRVTKSNAPVPAAAADGTADLSVKTVVLFSSGVAYFEHAGRVRGSASTELRFRSGQINDILKSLLLQDAGGRVGSVVYPSQEPLARTLKSFQVDITENPSLAALLNQLRGARVTLRLPTEGVTGTVLGVEQRWRLAHNLVDEKFSQDYWVINLVTAGGTIRSLPLDDVAQVRLDEPRLQEELDRALAALAQARDQEKKPLTIRFEGAGERAVRIAYVVEAPVWKTSYRLVLGGEGNDGSASSSSPAHLQGWALVENQTDNDWNDVRLTLVSGRPISFIQDLYRPLYLPRPVVRPQMFAGLQPQTYEGGREAQDAASGGGAGASTFAAAKLARATDASVSERRSRRPMAMAAVADMAEEQAGTDFADAGVVSAASAGQVGELFQYSVPGVSLPRQRSAMIPIVTDAVEVERVSIFNRHVLPRHPLTGALLTNTTGKHLLQGPVTVLEGGSYAGDARIDNVPPGQRRLVSWGIDLQVFVDCPDPVTNGRLVGGAIVRGTLRVFQRRVATREYKVENKADRSKVLIIEEPITAGHRLSDTPEPMETTETHYRFRIVVEAGGSTTFTSRSESLETDHVALLDATDARLDYFAQRTEIPQTVRDALRHAMQLARAAAEARQEVERRRKQIDELTSEQSRIRENLKTAPDKSQYHTRLLNKLNDQETQIESLREEIDQHTQAADERRGAMEDYLVKLDIA